MYAVGRVGTYLAQGVYTVSGPFHPFGGAVDIIVVQQEDGTFKSSPWYVKFGKFQGVLKRREKKVLVSVNDGDANFHMYLDHKGEAYFLKDAQGDDDVAALSPTEAPSSGDESSSHILALEYPKGEEGPDARAHRGKEESEDERGDDLELRFEGREASKQLIQQSVEERARVAEDDSDDVRGKFNSDIDAPESPSRLDLSENNLVTDMEVSETLRQPASGNGMVIHALLKQAVGLEAGQSSTAAGALVANAAVAALKSASGSDDTTSENACTAEGKTASSNGVIIHGLLNKALGLRPSQTSGPASALVATAALASLQKAVSDQPSGTSLSAPYNQPKLVEVLEHDLDTDKVHELPAPGSSEVPLEASVSDSKLSESLISNSKCSDDIMPMATIDSLKCVSEHKGLVDQSEVSRPSVDSSTLVRDGPAPENTMVLDVRKVEVLDESLVVKVQRHEKKDIAAPIVSDEVKRNEETDISLETNGMLETIVIDRKQMIQKIHDLQGCSQELPAGKIVNDGATVLEPVQESSQEEVVNQAVSVHVDKLLVENLNDVLSQNEADLNLILPDNNEVSNAAKTTAPVSLEETEGIGRSDIKTSGKPVVLHSPMNLTGQEVTSAGKEQLVSFDSIKNTQVDSTGAGKETSLLSPDVSSPRLKAAIELEAAWRDVIENAAAILRVAPYTSKRLKSTSSYGKKGPAAPGNVSKKPEGMDGLREHPERKTWGGWFWGGSSAPQPKQTAEQSSLKDPPQESSMDLGSYGFRDDSGAVSDLEDVANSVKHGERFLGDTQSKVGVKETTIGDLGPEKAANEEPFSRGKLEDQREPSLENKTQKRVQDEPPIRRRSLFGLLSRSSTNQSSLSSVSMQSSDDSQPMVHGLERETSLERAESVVDLLEVKWARGSAAMKGLKAITNVPDAGIIYQTHDSNMETGNLNLHNARAGLQPIDALDSSLTLRKSEGGAEGNESVVGQDSPPSSKQINGPEIIVGQVVDDQDEKLGAAEAGHIIESDTKVETKHVMDHQPEIEQDEKFGAAESDHLITSDKEAETEHVTDHQPEIELVTNGPEVGSISLLLSDIPTKKVVLMSIDGHLLTAPLVSTDDEPPQASSELHEQVCTETVENRRIAGSPQRRAVCFAGISDIRSGSSLGTNDLVRNGEHHIQQGKGSGQLGQGGLESDKYVSDGFVREIKTSSSSEGLKELAKLVAVDNVGFHQYKVDGSHGVDSDASEFTEALGATSSRDTATEKTGNDKGSTDTIDSKDFEEMRAMVFDKLDEHSDGEGLDSEQQGLERYYSSKDLTETEDQGERVAFRRNLSVYMDAMSGEEDEQETSASSHENDLGQSLRSHPIVIPGALERVRNSHSLDDICILKNTSESLPNARYLVINSDVASPRPLSRSLDSEPPSIILTPNASKQIPPADSTVTARPSMDSSLRSEGDEPFVSKSRSGNAKDEQPSKDTGGPSTGDTTVAAIPSSIDDSEKGPETGFELSLCRHLLAEGMGVEAAAKAFAGEKVTLDEFKKSGSAIAINDKLVVRVGGRYYPWVVAAPIVLGILAFGEVLTAPNEGAIPVEQPVVVFDGKAVTSTITPTTSGGWKLWPFGSIRRPKTPEKAIGATFVSRDAMIVATEAALKSSLTKEYLRMNGYYKRPRKVRTNSPSSQQLASLNLKEGSNKISFTFVTRMLGKQQVDARIYLWKWNTRIVISDVDGTITKSDVLGQVMPLMGKDWTQSGVAKLFSAIKNNGYELMFLSARAISQAYITRQFLENIKQDGEVLPDGPVVISPDGLFPSLYREVIRRAPHEFKIACLEDIKSLFPPESKPFYAGFGNRDTDELSYLKVGISKGKIFIINPKGEVVVNNQVDIKSYTSLHKLVHDMFPAMTFTEQEDYNEWNFWKLPLPDIEDELSVKSAGSSSSKRGGKAGR